MRVARVPEGRERLGHRASDGCTRVGRGEFARRGAEGSVRAAAGKRAMAAVRAPPVAGSAANATGQRRQPQSEQP
eukprot:10718713-Lingulodinium_polyedra.AAC.1